MASWQTPLPQISPCHARRCNAVIQIGALWEQPAGSVTVCMHAHCAHLASATGTCRLHGAMREVIMRRVGLNAESVLLGGAWVASRATQGTCLQGPTAAMNPPACMVALQWACVVY